MPCSLCVCACVPSALLRRHAFAADSLLSLVYQIVRGNFPPIPTDMFSKGLSDLVNTLLVRDPNTRPSLRQVGTAAIAWGIATGGMRVTWVPHGASHGSYLGHSCQAVTQDALWWSGGAGRQLAAGGLRVGLVAVSHNTVVVVTGM